MKYQTPSNEIIEGVTPESAILKLREKRGHLDDYYKEVYRWKLHADGQHLIQVKTTERRGGRDES
jgi:hypothetical protein